MHYYYYQIYIGLAQVVAPKAQQQPLRTRSRRLNIFDSTPPAQPRESHQQSHVLSSWLRRTVDYRFGRVQIEWCGDVVAMSSRASGPSEGMVGVFEKTAADGSLASEVGIVRLYRSTKAISDTAAEATGQVSDGQPAVLAVLAVPGYMTPTDFLSFAGPFRDSIEHVRVVRDRSANHYMILLKLRDAQQAAEFHAYYSGKTFSPLEPETCHVVYVSAVECELCEVSGDSQALLDESSRRVCAQPAALFLRPADAQAKELPTCPVCLERLDASASGLLTTLCQHTFHCRCLQRWGDGACPVCRYTQTSPFVDQERFHRTVGGNSPVAPDARALPPPPPISASATAATTAADGSESEANCCHVCGCTGDLWICLVCGTIGCGRYVNGHAKDHFSETQHPYSMELQSQCVWDYVGDGYVHRLVQSMADRKVIALDACAPSPTIVASGQQHGQHASFVEAREKLDAVTQEYELLLASQLESQREHYEMQIARLIHHHTQRPHSDATAQPRLVWLEQRLATQQTAYQAEVQRLRAERDQERRESAAERGRLEASVAKSLKRATDDAQLLQEERAMAQQLAANQDALNKQIDDLNAVVADLQEQVRDLTFFITTQDAIQAGGGSAELEGASVVAVANPPPPPTKGRGKGRRGALARR
ncbi:hypothetical protein GGI20_006002 [Coemansia sp. BCRC 34301]|nr:hypothetical protein GGI20_006002 [Coemansia sp. BCRC 34301]